MNTQLLIELFDIESEEFVDEIDISHYDLKKINIICPPYDEFDYQYCDSYEIMEADYINLKYYITELQNIDFTKFSMGIITRRI